MSIDPGRYWQDIDDPNWSDEKDAQFITALGIWSVENSLRPRDEFDVDVHPETLRGKVLAYYDARDAAMEAILATRRGRLLWRLISIRMKLARWWERRYGEAT